MRERSWLKSDIQLNGCMDRWEMGRSISETLEMWWMVDDDVNHKHSDEEGKAQSTFLAQAFGPSGPSSGAVFSE